MKCVNIMIGGFGIWIDDLHLHSFWKLQIDGDGTCATINDANYPNSLTKTSTDKIKKALTSGSRLPLVKRLTA